MSGDTPLVILTHSITGKVNAANRMDVDGTIVSSTFRLIRLVLFVEVFNPDFT